MSEPHHAPATAPHPLRVACLSWTLIPIGWALMFAAFPSGNVLEMNETLASLGLLVGAAGVVTAILGLVVAVRAARRRHPGPRGAIAFAVAGNAIALGTVVVVSFAALAGYRSPAGELGDFGSPERHPIADRPVYLAGNLLGSGKDVVWSGRRRPAPGVWHDGTRAAPAGRNGIAAVTADGTELWRRKVVGTGRCVVRGIAIDAAGDMVASCGATAVAVAEDGSDVWSRRFDGYVIRGLVSDRDGRVYLYARPRHATDFDTMVTRPDIVAALSPTGGVRWQGRISRLGAIRRFSDGSEIQVAAAAPARGGGIVLATKSNVIDLAADGSRRWHVASGKDDPVDITALLVGRDGTIYLAGSATEGFVQAISADGSPRWVARTGPDVQAIALGRDGTLYALTWADLFEYSTR